MREPMEGQQLPGRATGAKPLGRAKARRCRLGLHSLDDDCVCVRCGRERHRPDSYVDWVAEEGIDTSYGIWWNYQEAGYEVTYCGRCGRRLGRSHEPVQFRGRP
jgi:hypothetical protein